MIIELAVLQIVKSDERHHKRHCARDDTPHAKPIIYVHRWIKDSAH